MKIIQPRPFTFEAGSRAVLLLHGFTGHSADVRMLGRFLQKKGYSSHAPIYRGHGVPPEELIKTTPKEWWEDVNKALDHMHYLGYQEIAVAGLSLGAVLGLKLAYMKNIKAVIPMSAPKSFDNNTQLKIGFQAFSKEYKQLERKENKTIEEEVNDLLEKSVNMFQQMGEFIIDVMNNINTIYTPTFVIQGSKDQMISRDSAPFIYQNIEADRKEIKWYEESGHVITLDKERDQLHEDIYEFLESLDWEE